jgi:glycosyltransferase involved in cell wall biosynthesis
MTRILLLTPNLPVPARANGITLRLNPLLRALAAQHEVHLVACSEERTERLTPLIEECRTLVASVSSISLRQGRWRVRAGLVHSLAYAPRPPHELLFPFSGDAVRHAVGLAAAHDIQLVLSVDDSLGHVAAALARRIRHARHVLDWIDSPALRAARSLTTHDALRERGVAALRRWEATVNAGLDRVVYISEADALAATGNLADNARVVPNGVLDEDGSGLAVAAPLQSLPRLTLGFLGNMGYEPNHTAAMRLVRDILPAVQAACPELAVRVKVIGRHPQAELKALAGERVCVTGEVDSIWTAIEDVDICVFPMALGAGLQNKVLEAMRAGRPVVMTAVCASGLPGVQESGGVIADDDKATASGVAMLAGDREAVLKRVRAGRLYVERYRWEAIVPAYERAIGLR